MDWIIFMVSILPLGPDLVDLVDWCFGVCLRSFLLPASPDVSAVQEFNRNHEINANSSNFLLIKRIMD